MSCQNYGEIQVIVDNLVSRSIDFNSTKNELVVDFHCFRSVQFLFLCYTQWINLPNACAVWSRIAEDAVPVARVGRRREKGRREKGRSSKILKEVFKLKEVEMRAYMHTLLKMISDYSSVHDNKCHSVR